MVLPGDFEAGKNYLVSGKTLLAWRKALLADRVLPGANLTETQGPDGRVFKAAAGGDGGVGNPAFFRLFVDGTNHMLQGGQVSGGTGNEVLEDIAIGTVGSEPADGTLRWLRITFSGSETDGWLNAGGDVTAAISQSGTSLPANTLPTAASPAGKYCYLLLGSWNEGGFYPSQGGNVVVGFCSAYTISRG